jgi:hypothetical protein
MPHTLTASVTAATVVSTASSARAGCASSRLLTSPVSATLRAAVRAGVDGRGLVWGRVGSARGGCAGDVLQHECKLGELIRL